MIIAAIVFIVLSMLLALANAGIAANDNHIPRTILNVGIMIAELMVLLVLITHT